MFTDSDIQLIQKRGSDPKEIERQIENFKRGFPSLKLDKAATIGEGITKVSDENVLKYISLYEEQVKAKKVIKFVPASGAASRMFKALFEFKESYGGTEEEYDQLQSKKGDVYHFFSDIKKFAFYEDLKEVYEKTNAISLEDAVSKGKYVSVLDALLEEEGLGYGKLPKGLLKFHNYDDGNRTPVEEHIIEGINYAKDSQGNVLIHLTVSPEHEGNFKEHVKAVKSKYESAHGVKVSIDYSEQKPGTDTIAVDMNNEPFVEGNGQILFRPGGHGALIENLNDLSADIIFVKNIDNVVPDHLKSETFKYKKVLGGILLELQNKIFSLLSELTGEAYEAHISEAIDFIENDLCFKIPDEINKKTTQEQVDLLTSILNRPLRLCGMVKNEGEPGGGPFWSTNSDESVSLQIVESAQVDLEDAEQKEIFQGSTHFNPVDLVCAVKDFQGNDFDLLQYRDENTGFIAYKSKSGRDLKAQELPGLWNGAMANWNTVFVEVPLITFNPVKKVTDLLKDTHQ